MNLLEINFLAVLVSAIATFALGAAWYAPALFGKQWVAAHGFTPERVEAMRKGAAKAYGTTFVCWVVMAAALAVLMHRIGVDTLAGGVKVAALCWVGFSGTVGLSAHVFSDRKPAAFLIDGLYQLVSMLVMGIILALWH